MTGTGGPATAPAGRNRRWLVRLALLAIVAGIFAVIVPWSVRKARGPAPEPTFARTLTAHPVAVAPGLYLLGRLAPAAAYAVDTSEGLVLIDTGLEPDAASLLAQLRELGLDVGRLRAILLTHAHADHSAGAAVLRSRTGARVYAGRADSGPLARGGPREAFVSTFHLPGYQPRPTPPDVELDDEQRVEFGDARFLALAAPGHSPGSVCYLLERPGLRALFSGDVIQALSATGGRPLGTYAVYLSPRYRASARDYLASLRRLRALPVPDLVLPGHPRLDRTPQSPRLGEEHWHALLDGGIKEMERVVARYEADGANFLDGTPRELVPGLCYLGDHGDSAVYCLINDRGTFLIDAPGAPSLPDFLTEGFAKLGRPGQRPTAVLLTSADEPATAGLKALVGRTGCSVVAPEAGAEAVRRLCPPGTTFLSVEEFRRSSGLEFETIPLAGRGLSPVAYQVTWKGKTVLLSGRLPVKVSEASVEQLFRDVGLAGAQGYLRSLDRLMRVRPDLWLPALPVHGQNANLYDEDWKATLGQNARVIMTGPSGGR